MNKFLSICIPTHNRAPKLSDALEKLLPIIERFDLGVYISDNASVDHTKDIVEAYQGRSVNIIYHRNEEDLGWIRNFEDVIRMPASQYSWLCGDDDLIVMDAIENILQILSEEKPELLVVNGGKKQKNAETYLCSLRHVRSQLYTDKNSLLADVGSYMSWMSGLIFQRDFLRCFSLVDYSWSPFAHMVAIFDTLAKKKSIKVYFKAEPCVYVNRMNSTGDDYTPKILEYFSKEWLNIEEFLEDYSKEARQAFLYGYRDHITEFGVLKFLFLRMEGKYNYAIYKKLKHELKYITRLSDKKLLLISLLPPILPKSFVTYLNQLRMRLSKWV